MIRSLMTAASGMKAQQKQVDSIANNIANVNTTGFKRNELSFRSLLYQTYREPGAPVAASQMSPTGLQIGSGVEVAGSYQDFRQGEMVGTGSQLDLAVQGEGFFRLRMPNGDFRYTRDGSFRLDGNGTIVTDEGYLLEGAPTIPSDAVSLIVAEDGTLAVLQGDDQPPAILGTIDLHRFANSPGLKVHGGNLFSETASSGVPQQQPPGQNGTGTIRQGFKERSNVAVVDELVSLILAQRNYEVNSRAVRVSDEMLQETNQMIR
jgi:flagellar basal-body rod protein FlgG